MKRDSDYVWCPTCKDDRIQVNFTGTCELTAEGSVDCGNHEYDEKSPAECVSCGHGGPLRLFLHDRDVQS